jgi:hypothetical protein
LLKNPARGKNNRAALIAFGTGGEEMKKILLLVICLMVIGCAARDFVPSGYSLSGSSGAAFSVKDMVWVQNATPSRVEKLGINMQTDLKDWGNQLAYGLKYNLKQRGALIDRKAKKKISVQVTHAEVKNKLLRYTAYMECTVKLGNGYAQKFTASHSAQIDEDACSGLLPVVIERIMSNSSVVRYLREA